MGGGTVLGAGSSGSPNCQELNILNGRNRDCTIYVRRQRKKWMFAATGYRIPFGKIVIPYWDPKWKLREIYGQLGDPYCFQQADEYSFYGRSFHRQRSLHPPRCNTSISKMWRRYEKCWMLARNGIFNWRGRGTCHPCSGCSDFNLLCWNNVDLSVAAEKILPFHPMFLVRRRKLSSGRSLSDDQLNTSQKRRETSAWSVFRSGNRSSLVGDCE